MRDTSLTKRANKKVSPMFDRVLACVLTVAIAPFWMFNALYSFAVCGRIFLDVPSRSDVRASFSNRSFRHGVFKSSLILLEVAKGYLRFIGLTPAAREYQRLMTDRNESTSIARGLISLVDIHNTTGLSAFDHAKLISEQVALDSPMFTVRTLAKYTLVRCLYHNAKCNHNSKFSLFGVTINNVTMSQAVDWITEKRRDNNCHIGLFVNVNSINLSYKLPKLREYINAADHVFADGSGMRIAARQCNQALQDNVNGTDLLPHLCQAAQAKGLRIFLLGAEPGIADKACQKLLKDYPNLHIAGTHHGYFNREDDAYVVDYINSKNTDILLVALGSPLQEQWLIENRRKLTCGCALAVGGLFDFFSGKIPRAPMVLRELGLEWIWRLIQEPKAKFRRYVLGNPLFLIRTFLFNQARTSL